MVCSKAHGNCCCGWTEKGRTSVNTNLYEQEWENRRIRNRVHLSFTGCLGPCAVGNNALLQLSGRSIWFKDLNDDKYIPLIFDFIEVLLKDIYAPVPTLLAENVFERYLPPIYASTPAPSQNPVQIKEDRLQSGELEGLTAPVETRTGDSSLAVTPGMQERPHGEEDPETLELARIDPVCLMEVDSTTARFESRYAGRNYYFCAPACKKAFDKEPVAYI